MTLNLHQLRTQFGNVGQTPCKRCPGSLGSRAALALRRADLTSLHAALLLTWQKMVVTSHCYRKRLIQQSTSELRACSHHGTS